MSFTVVFGVFVIIVIGINGCPSPRPCTTPNGSQGYCIQSKECPSISRLNGANLTPEELNFLKKLQCGIDKDRSTLFCCDANETRPGGQVINKFGSDSIDRNNVVVVEDPSVPIREIYSHSSTTPPAPTPTTTSSTTPPAPTPTTTARVQPTESTVVYCQTPNGEQAQCRSIYQCPVFIISLAGNTTENQKKFLRESSCGFDNQLPLVCCGSDTNFVYNNEEENNSNFKQNPLIPVDSCGTHNRELQERMPVSSNKRQTFQQPTEMNITFPNRIFGGMNSELDEFPWVALLYYQPSNGKPVFACGGSLISSRYILTAAHCVSEQSAGTNLTGVRLGEWDYSKDGKDCVTEEGRTACNDAEISIGIESVQIHPQYKPRSKEKYHDIALVRLNTEVKFTNHIKPICLPSIDDYVPPGERLTIAGWGIVNYDETTTIKQKVEVPLVSWSQCSLMFEKSPKFSRIGRGQYCAGGEDGKDACVGDSGAPLMRKKKELWYVEGIVSFGSGCGVINHYGVYTKVSEYLSWIHRTIVK